MELEERRGRGEGGKMERRRGREYIYRSREQHERRGKERGGEARARRDGDL